MGSRRKRPEGRWPGCLRGSERTCETKNEVNHLIPDNVSITICGIQDNVSISICGIVSWIIQCCISYSGSLVVYTLCKRQLRYQIRIILANHSSTQWSVDKNIVLSLTHFCQIRHNRSLTHFCQIRHNPSKYCFAISIIIRKRNVINTNYFILIENSPFGFRQIRLTNSLS